METANTEATKDQTARAIAVRGKMVTDDSGWRMDAERRRRVLQARRNAKRDR